MEICARFAALVARPRVAGLPALVRRRGGRLFLVAALALGILAPADGASAVQLTVLVVNSTADAATAGGCAAGTGICTLRAAIVEANARFGPTTINVPAGTYVLTIAGGDDAAQGDLDVAGNLTLVGAGPGRTIIDAVRLAPSDRVFDIRPGATAGIARVTIRHGAASGDGGGVRNAGTLTLRDVEVARNAAGDDGGGVMNEAGGTLTMVRTAVVDNFGADDGGGVRNDGTLTIRDSAIRANASGDDAAGMRNDGRLTIARSAISGNIAADTSGGIENRGTLELSDSVVDGNRADGGDAGGLQNQSGGTMTVARSTVSGNASAEDGGGIDIDVGTASFTNVTVSGNRARVDGGGLEVSDGAAVSLVSVTLAGNMAARGSGLFNDPDFPATVTIRSTILANDTSGGNCAGAPPASRGANLEFPGKSCNLSAALGDLLDADPLLGRLGPNGGATPTHALSPGSPAIDAVRDGCPPPETDQRGVPRPADGDGDGVARCDIGAFER